MQPVTESALVQLRRCPCVFVRCTLVRSSQNLCQKRTRPQSMQAQSKVSLPKPDHRMSSYSYVCAPVPEPICNCLAYVPNAGVLSFACATLRARPAAGCATAHRKAPIPCAYAHIDSRSHSGRLSSAYSLLLSDVSRKRCQ